MAATERTRQRFWHWRRNELRRPSDRAEAWLLLTAWTLAVAGGGVAGSVTGQMVADTAEQQRAARQEVVATLTEKAPARTSGDAGFGDVRVTAPVRWTDGQGRVHHTDTQVPPKTGKGTEVALWIGPDGRPTSAPPSTGEQLGGAIATGSMTALGVGGTVLLAERGARYALDRRRLRQWEREWAVVEPAWRRKTG